MKNNWIMSDYRTEQIFSILRWIFLLISVVVFYYPPIASIVSFTIHTFNYLLVFGFIYMFVAQIALFLVSEDKVIFSVLMKIGIVFDYIALIWLLVLSGGITSPLFPISYLLIMHATIYWRVAGAILSCTVMALSYFMLFLIHSPHPSSSIVIFALNMTFLFVIGFFGALIVNRERFHYKLQGKYKDGMIRDYLTGLYNHRHFQESIKIHVQNKKGYTVLLGDIDNFKRINDKHGHVVGDRVLAKIGEIFKSSIPPSIGSAFRYGGEEFAILFDTVDKDKVIPYVNQIYKNLQDNQFSSEKGLFSVTMSFGLFSELNMQSEFVDSVKKADELLYKAKSKGKNQAIFDCGTIVKGSIHKKEVS